MLRSNTLFGLVDKEEIAIQRLRMFEPPEGYWGGFSGGKDSQTVYHLAQKAGVKVEWHMNLTTVDPPEVIQFVRQYYPDVSIDRPPKTMWQLIVDNRMPPTRIKRYCCAELKERGGIGRTVLTGIRAQESVNRSKRKMVEQCHYVSKWYVHPIIDWEEADVWEFIHQEGLAYCRLYDEGRSRIGCIGCPFGGWRQMEKDFARWPKYKEAYLRAFEKTIAKRHELGLESKSWVDAQSMMDWWMYGEKEEAPNEQLSMFV